MTDGWEKFTTTRPFKRCLQCRVDLAPSAGDLCSRCRMAEERSVAAGRGTDPHPDDHDEDDSPNIYPI